MGQSATVNAAAASGSHQQARPSLSLAKCRAILGTDCPEKDADLARLRDQLYGLARIVVEAIPGDGRLMHSPRTPKGASSAFDDGAKGHPAPANFSEEVASLPEDERYEIEERAAIHEFDGGLDRSAAEQRALLEYWRAKHGRNFND